MSRSRTAGRPPPCCRRRSPMRHVNQAVCRDARRWATQRKRRLALVPSSSATSASATATCVAAMELGGRRVTMVVGHTSCIQSSGGGGCGAVRRGRNSLTYFALARALSKIAYCTSSSSSSRRVVHVCRFDLTKYMRAATTRRVSYRNRTSIDTIDTQIPKFHITTVR